KDIAQEFMHRPGRSGARQKVLVIAGILKFVGGAGKNISDLFRGDHRLPPVSAQSEPAGHVSGTGATLFQRQRLDFFEVGLAGAEHWYRVDLVKIFPFGYPELWQVRVIEPLPKLFVRNAVLTVERDQFFAPLRVRNGRDDRRSAAENTVDYFLDS